MARVSVRVWASLTHLFATEQVTPRSIEVEIVEGMTLLDFLRELAADYPRFGAVMFEPETGEPSTQVSVLVNDRLPDLLAGFETRLRDADRVSLVQAYAGGSGLLPTVRVRPRGWADRRETR
jgi:molybdopterin converting factor small subunit